MCVGTVGDFNMESKNEQAVELAHGRAKEVYELYQLRETPENEPYQFQSYAYWLAHGRAIHRDDYELVCEGRLLPEETAHDVRASLERRQERMGGCRALGTGDVLLLRRVGAVNGYFVDQDGLMPLEEFLYDGTAQKGMRLETDAKDYSIPGKPGLWVVADTLLLEDSMFFLMEHKTYGRNANRIILDAEGRIVEEDNTADFDEVTQRRLLAYLHPGNEEPAGTGVEPEALNKHEERRERSPLKRRISVRQRLKEKQAQIYGGSVLRKA